MGENINILVAARNDTDRECILAAVSTQKDFNAEHARLKLTKRFAPLTARTTAACEEWSRMCMRKW
jgi:hypothetical protein